MFNSLKYAKKLEEAGVPREQAETHLMILSEVMETTLATRQDLKDLKNELTTEMRSGFQQIDSRFIQLEQRMTIKLGTIVTIAMGALVAIQKLF